MAWMEGLMQGQYMLYGGCGGGGEKEKSSMLVNSPSKLCLFFPINSVDWGNCVRDGWNRMRYYTEVFPSIAILIWALLTVISNNDKLPWWPNQLQVSCSDLKFHEDTSFFSVYINTELFCCQSNQESNNWWPLPSPSSKTFLCKL